MEKAKPGEPEKLTPKDMVFSGCSDTNGKGFGIVCETGMHTRIGRIAQLIASDGGGKGMKKCGCLPDTRAGAEALPGQLLCILIDYDIVSHQQVSRFGQSDLQKVSIDAKAKADLYR